MKNKSPIDENELKEAIASRDEKKLKAFYRYFY